MPDKSPVYNNLNSIEPSGVRAYFFGKIVKMTTKITYVLSIAFSALVYDQICKNKSILLVISIIIRIHMGVAADPRFRENVRKRVEIRKF